MTNPYQIPLPGRDRAALADQAVHPPGRPRGSRIRDILIAGDIS
jgi:hypothetical protein